MTKLKLAFDKVRLCGFCAAPVKDKHLCVAWLVNTMMWGR